MLMIGRRGSAGSF
jgi:hypothetical protein